MAAEKEQLAPPPIATAEAPSETTKSNLAAASSDKGKVGIRLVSAPQSSVTVTGSPLFGGSASTSMTPELYVRGKVSTLLSQSVPDGIFVEGNLGLGGDYNYEATFAGASLGSVTSSSPFGLAVGWETAVAEKCMLEASIGAEHRDWSGQYTLGGAVLSQTKPGAWSTTLRVGGSYKLTKDMDLNAGLKYVSTSTSSVTPVAGNTVSMSTGGISGWIGVSHSF